MTHQLTIQSALHGERIWRRVGERDHTTRDGRPTVLALWELACVICGQGFEVTTAANVAAVEQSKSLLVFDSFEKGAAAIRFGEA